MVNDISINTVNIGGVLCLDIFSLSISSLVLLSTSSFIPSLIFLINESINIDWKSILIYSGIGIFILFLLILIFKKKKVKEEDTI